MNWKFLTAQKILETLSRIFTMQWTLLLKAIKWVLNFFCTVCRWHRLPSPTTRTFFANDASYSSESYASSGPLNIGQQFPPVISLHVLWSPTTWLKSSDAAQVKTTSPEVQHESNYGIFLVNLTSGILPYNLQVIIFLNRKSQLSGNFPLPFFFSFTFHWDNQEMVRNHNRMTSKITMKMYFSWFSQWRIWITKFSIKNVTDITIAARLEEERIRVYLSQVIIN